MRDDDPKIPDNLRMKFPHLRPIKGVPSLITMNGFGVGLYGKRDFDQETETYIKTRCVCALFIPLFAIDAYRVADAGNRTWYFLGKESLSTFARSWNTAIGCLVAFAALAVGWDIHTSSPAYKAEQEIKRAAQLFKAGEIVKAAGIYRQQVSGPSGTVARKGLQESVEACLNSDKAQTVAAGLHLLVGVPANVNQPAPLVPDSFNRGMSLVAKFRPADPEGALSILAETSSLDPKSALVKPLKMELLKESITAKPENTNRVVELALLYEADEKLDECVTLLLPYKQKLGDSEGARILGQQLLSDGKNEDAYDLLFPYVQVRLQKLRRIESAYTNTIATISHRVVEELRAGQGDPSFYNKYEKATKAAKEEMVDDYIQARLQRDPGYQRAVADLKAANQIVHVTLDLGLVQLNRAQSLKGVAERKAELEAAEKTFLAISGLAGETDQYRMFLGQVYYWLGRADEGKKLFDQLLAARKRDYAVLMALSRTLRVVGENVQARALAEEAYRTAKTDTEKFAAAIARSLLFKDIEDQIAWLEKTDTNRIETQIELNSARGKQALLKGNKNLAADYLRKAITGYETQVKSSAMLNNCGLACFDLYEATGNLQDTRRGMSMLEDAIRMDPGNSILLHNTMYFLFSRAVMDVMQGAIRTELLGEQPGFEMLGYLYRDGTERTTIYQALRDNENMRKAVSYLDKVLLLAPKNIGEYATALTVHGSFRDLPELQRLQQRFRVAMPDQSEIRDATLSTYKGTKDKEALERLQTQIQTFENFIKQPAVQQHAGTLEHATLRLWELRQKAAIYGQSVDSAKLVESITAVHEKHKTSASHHALKAAYAFRANEELSKQSPEYAALAVQTQHVMSPEYLLAFIIEQNGRMAGLARKNGTVLKFLEVEQEIIEKFPSWVNIDDWALLRNVAPEIGVSLGKRYKENETGRLIDEIQFQLNPLNAAAVLEQYWTNKLLGDEKHAQEIYRQGISDGVPLPQL